MSTNRPHRPRGFVLLLLFLGMMLTTVVHAQPSPEPIPGPLSLAGLADLIKDQTGNVVEVPWSGYDLPEHVELRNVTLNFSANGGALLSVSADATYTVSLDDANKDRIFKGPAVFTLTDGQPTLSLTAELEGAWAAPFGVTWLILESVSFTLDTSEEQLTGGYKSSFKLGDKTVGLEINLAEGEQSSASLIATVDHLSSEDFTELLDKQLPQAVSPLTDRQFDFNSVTMTIDNDAFAFEAETVVYEVELDGAPRRFSGPAHFNLTDGAVDFSLGLSLEGSWSAPFGVTWLDLQEASFRLEVEGGQGEESYRSFFESSFKLGDKTVALDIELVGGSTSSARLTGAVDQLSMADFTALVKKQLPDIVPFEGSNLDLIFKEVTMTLMTGDTGSSFSLGAATTLNGTNADLLFSATKKGNTTHVMTGFQIQDWSLGSALGLKGPIAEIEIETVALMLSKATGEVRLESTDLSPEVYDFYHKVYAAEDFTLTAQPGVSLVAPLPLPTSMSGPIAKVLGQDIDQLLLTGTLPGKLLGLGAEGKLSLQADLPKITLEKSPPWLKAGQLGFFIEADGKDVAAGMKGTLDVIIDETDMVFSVEGAFETTPPAITLSGRLEAEAWHSPFDVSWLTIYELGVALSAKSTGSLEIGLSGRADIAEKNLDIDIALAMNLAGVPTNFVFRAASTTPFGVDDLIKLQEQLTSVEMPAVVADAIPRYEIRPVDEQTPIEVTFALRDFEDVKAGFALRGMLLAQLVPSGPLEEMAVTDTEISLSGIFIHADVQRDITVGRFGLTQPITVDIVLEAIPQPRGLFVLKGEADLLLFTRHIDVTLSKESDLSPAINKVKEIVAVWKTFDAAFKQDPVNAMHASLNQLFSIAEVDPQPTWPAELFENIEKARQLFPGGSSSTLLEYALQGVSVNVYVCPGLINKIPYQGKCWDVLPSDIGAVGAKKAIEVSKVPRWVKTTCKRWWRNVCVGGWNYRIVYECPAISVASGGKCYTRVPGVPKLSNPSTPVPAGSIPGLCNTLPISCSVDGLKAETIAPLIKNAVADLLDRECERVSFGTCDGASASRLVISDGVQAVDSTALLQQARHALADKASLETAHDLPKTFSLGGNYPNPFNPTTTINFALPEATAVRLAVYDLLGRRVQLLVDEQRSAGQHEVVFEARGLPSGVYFYRIEAGSFATVKQMTLVK